MATEKKLPPLMDDTSIQKISLLTDNIGVVYAGMGPDSRVLVRKGRKIAQQYFRTYHAPIPVNQLVRELAAIMQEFTQSGYAPPSVLLIYVLRAYGAYACHACDSCTWSLTLFSCCRAVVCDPSVSPS